LMFSSVKSFSGLSTLSRTFKLQNSSNAIVSIRGKKMETVYRPAAKSFPTIEDQDELKNALQPHEIFENLRDPEELTIMNETINIGRHVKITSGGRVFSFSALVVCGNCDGVASLGYGKAMQANEAVEKAIADAQKNFVALYRYQGRTIPYSMVVKNRSVKLMMAANREGSGVKGSYPLRVLAKAMGLDDITFKIYRSHNIHDVLRAVFKAMTDIVPPEDLAKKMGKKFINVAHYWNPKKDTAYHKRVLY